MKKDLSLKPFNLSQSSLLISWLPNKHFARTWGGPRYNWPVTTEQIKQYFAEQPVQPFWFCLNDKPIGYIELVEKPKNEISLCRIIIGDEKQRGKGYGKALIKLAIEKARVDFCAKSVELAVYMHNTNALNCYLGFGFEAYTHQNQDDSLNAMQRMRLFLS